MDSGTKLAAGSGSGLLSPHFKVAAFSFAHGLLGEGAKSAEAIGMSFAKGIATGDAQNLKLRFDPTYVQMAAEGKL